MTVISLLILIALPGIPLAAFTMRDRPLAVFLPIAGALGIAWTTTLSFALTWIEIPLTWGTILPVASAPALLAIYNRTTVRIPAFARPGTFVVVAALATMLAIPFLTLHNQLPTGDIQKAIFWASRIAEHGSLPDYAEAHTLNRDPSDFITPGLHTLTTAAMSLSGNNVSGPSWFAFTASMILAGLAASLAVIIAGRRAALPAFLIACLALPFLRYATAPGYHYQNLIGEIFLFSALALFLMATKANNKQYALLAISATLVILIPLVHQFTAFLAILLAPVMLIGMVYLQRKAITASWHALQPRTKRYVAAAVCIGMLAAAGGIMISPLPEKIPHLFTTDPHLANIRIAVSRYPSLIGPSLLLFGIGGIITMLFPVYRNTTSSQQRNTYVPAMLLTLFALMLLTLGQGPAFGLNIPSARTLFYATIPLAAFAGIFILHATGIIRDAVPIRYRIATAVLAPLLLIGPMARATMYEMSSLTHNTRTQATLTTELQTAINRLPTPHAPYPKDMPPAILIDDWNRRRLTWTILSPYAMVARVGGDLTRIADESSQSDIRREIYERHLDYETIFMIGNSTIIAPLLFRHNIHFIGTSQQETRTVFTESPLMEEIASGNDFALFQVNKDAVHDAMNMLDDESGFLLARTVLANDMGDAEDFLPHSALSIDSPNRPSASIESGRPVREITEPTDLVLNIGTYVRPFWDPDRKGKPNGLIRILIRAASNGARFRLETDTTTHSFTLPDNETFHTVAAVFDPEGLPFDERGLARITLVPEDGTAILDLVAAGPAR